MTHSLLNFVKEGSETNNGDGFREENNTRNINLSPSEMKGSSGGDNERRADRRKKNCLILMSVPTMMTVAVAKSSSNDYHTCEEGRGCRQKRKRTWRFCFFCFHSIFCFKIFCWKQTLLVSSNFCWKPTTNRHVGNREMRVDAIKCHAIIPMLYVHVSAECKGCGKEIKILNLALLRRKSTKEN